MKPMNVIRKNRGKTVEFMVNSIRKANDRFLNIGSSSTSFGKNSINLDIQKANGVHVVADAHSLPFVKEAFDICLLSAVLQYCENPFEVAKEVDRVLVSGGIAIIDAPFIQPYCLGAPDLYRFSKHGLEIVFNKHFEIMNCDVSIPTGSALAFYLQGIGLFATENRYLGFAITYVLSILMYPLSFLKFGNRHETAGAFILVGRKR